MDAKSDVVMPLWTRIDHRMESLDRGGTAIDYVTISRRAELRVDRMEARPNGALESDDWLFIWNPAHGLDFRYGSMHSMDTLEIVWAPIRENTTWSISQ